MYRCIPARNACTGATLPRHPPQVPPHSRLLVVSGGGGAWLNDLKSRKGAEGAALVDTWEVRTRISEAEAKEWAALATVCSAREKLVWVAFFNDGGIVTPDADEPSSRREPCSSADPLSAPAVRRRCNGGETAV